MPVLHGQSAGVCFKEAPARGPQATGSPLCAGALWVWRDVRCDYCYLSFLMCQLAMHKRSHTQEMSPMLAGEHLMPLPA